MKRRQYLLLVVLTVIAGLIGGAVSNWLFVARTAQLEGEEEDDKGTDRDSIGTARVSVWR